MIAMLTALGLLIAPQQTAVQIPVGDPVLPTGPLVAMGATGEGDIFMDAASVVRSDIPGLVDGTAVIVTTEMEPLKVMTFWINCTAHTYQVGSGRQYDRAGGQVALTSWIRDQPILPGTGAAVTEAAFCRAGGPDLTGLPVVADWRAALRQSITGAQ